MKAAARRVAEALAAAGVQTTVIECAQSTRTAEQAAAAMGTTVGRIVKSLVFMAGQEPLLALVSGANRLDTERLAAHLGRPVRRAGADEVREATGFGIGLVGPLICRTLGDSLLFALSRRALLTLTCFRRCALAALVLALGQLALEPEHLR